jgi:uncharacterized protein
VVEDDRWLTFAAAHIEASYPISYADASAAALAKEQRAILVTGDPEFASFDNAIAVRWLRQAGP